MLFVGIFTVSYHLKQANTVQNTKQDIKSFTHQITNSLVKEGHDSSIKLLSDIKNKKITITIETPENEQENRNNDHIRSIIKHLAKKNELESFSIKIDI